jgi:hypothetical protein
VRGSLTYDLADESVLSFGNDYGAALDVGLASTSVRARLRTVPTIADLVAADPTTSDVFSYVEVLGYTSAGDGGGGNVRRVLTSSGSTNRGTFLASTSNPIYAWQRLPDALGVTPQMFGAMGDGTNDDTTAIQAAWDARDGQPLYIPAGRYKVTGTLWLTNSTSDRSFIITGAGPSDNSGAEIFSTSTNAPIVVVAGGGGRVSGLLIRYDGASLPTNTNCVALKQLTVYNTTFSDISLKNAWIPIQAAEGYSHYSNQYFNVDVYGYSGTGWDMRGSGTQNFMFGCDIRNTPQYPNNTATGTPSNTGTNVTISGISAAFMTNLIVGNLVIVSGLSPSEFNGIHTVTATNATGLSYVLSAAPSGSVSGTASLEAYIGTAALYGIYQAGGNRSQWYGLNVEYTKCYAAVYSDGTMGINGLSLEGFTGVETSGYVIWLGQGGDVDNMDFFNCTFPTNSTYRLFGCNVNSTINAGTVKTRDLWYAGTTLNWVAGGGKLTFGGQHYEDASARWNRTSALSTPYPNSRLLRPASASAENIEFSIGGTLDRRVIITGTSIYARDNATGLTEKALTLQAANTSASLGIFTAGSTNDAVLFNPGTGNRRITFNGHTITASTNSTATTGGTLNLVAGTVKATGTFETTAGIELSHASDTTLSRLSAGQLAVEGVQVALKPTTETLTYSTTNVTITAGKGPMQRSLLTVTNNFQLLWSGLTDNDGGVVHLIPATTNVTVLVSSPGRAAGSSAATATGSTTLTITGATNGWAELAWSVVSVGGTNRVSVNLGAY